MSEQKIVDPTDSSTYLQHAERAKADKPPTRSTPLGAVAQSRAPGTTSRQEMQRAIMAQDGDLVPVILALCITNPRLSAASS